MVPRITVKASKTTQKTFPFKEEIITFFVNAIPRPKNYMLSRNKLYREASCVAFEKHIRIMAAQAARGRKVIGPVCLTLHITKFSNNKKKSDCCPTTPDCTNVLKSVEDALKNICFEDDRNVVEQHVYKYYCDKKEDEGIKVTIRAVQFLDI